jgi:hypothetical protein
MYTGNLKKGEEKIPHSTDSAIGSLSNQKRCCLSKLKIKNGLRKIFTETS